MVGYYIQEQISVATLAVTGSRVRADMMPIVGTRLIREWKDEVPFQERRAVINFAAVPKYAPPGSNRPV